MSLSRKTPRTLYNRAKRTKRRRALSITWRAATVVNRASKDRLDERAFCHVAAVAPSNFLTHSDNSNVRFHSAQKRRRCAR